MKPVSLATNIGLATAWVFALAIAVSCGPRADSALSNPRAANSILAQAVQKLEGADSYSFSIEANHHWLFEGQAQNWLFKGEGSFTKPDRFKSELEGPADTLLAVEINGNSVKAWDTRGEVSNATAAFGGPGYGSSPYLAILYMKDFGEASDLGPVTLDNAEAYRLEFKPDLSRVAAASTAFEVEMQKVTKVRGEVWIRKRDSVIRKEVIEVDFISRGGNEEKVTLTLKFNDYGG